MTSASHSFDTLDRALRRYETAHDHCVLPGLWMVARLDGHSFTRLTRETHPFQSPFDPAFRELMTATTEHLMTCGFRFLYGYTQSDEISLLFHPQAAEFNRKLRKLNSILAGEASAAFSLALGHAASFDCRISQLPSPSLVADYFHWRQLDAARNALNAHCYWTLRRDGQSVQRATAALQGLSTGAKNELLFQHGVNFNDLPLWHKRGVGVLWATVEKEGFNPLTEERVMAQRRLLERRLDLPMKEEYRTMILNLLPSEEKNL
ncbi:MAG: guanylyltransferase [Chloroflexi bacterium]|nr:guanylyltransferase [Chloroflexota bacterium]